MTFLDKIKGWLMEIVEVGLILIALGVVLQILLGSPLPFIGNVVQNLMALIKVLGDGGLIGGTLREEHSSTGEGPGGKFLRAFLLAPSPAG